MRQKLIDTQILGHKEHITLYAACDALLSISKESGAYSTLVTATKRFKNYFCDIYLDKFSNRDLCCWVAHERQRGVKDITIRLWSMQFNKICRYGGHRSVNKNRALTTAFIRAGLTDVSPHCLRRTFATRLLSRGAAITDVQHLLGHASVKTTERAYAAFVRNERFMKTIELLDQPNQPTLKGLT